MDKKIIVRDTKRRGAKDNEENEIGLAQMVGAPARKADGSGSGQYCSILIF